MSRKPRTLKEMRADPRVAFVFYQKGEKTPWSVWLKNGWHLDESVLFHCRTIKHGRGAPAERTPSIGQAQTQARKINKSSC